MGANKNSDSVILTGTGDGSEADETTETELIDSGDDLDAVLADLGGEQDALITVSKVNRQGKREIVERYHPADFDLFNLRDQFGGGEYFLTGRRGNKIAKGFPKKVILAEPREKPRQVDQGGNLAEVMRDGFAQQQQMMENFIKLMMTNQPQASQPDPDAVRRGIMQDMIQMKELFNNGQQAQGIGPEKVLELLKTGMELGKESAGGDRSVLDVLTETVKTFGEPISNAIKQQQMAAARQQHAAGQGQAQGQGQAMTTETGQPAVDSQQAASPADKGEGDQVAMMKMYVGHLVNEAEKGGDPLLWADVIMSYVPEDDLRTILQQMDPVDYLGNIDNRVFHYREWFAELGADLKKQLGIPDVSGPGDTTKPAEPGDGEPAAIESHGSTGDDPAGQSGGDSHT